MMEVARNNYFIGQGRVVRLGPYRPDSKTYHATNLKFGAKGLVSEVFALPHEVLRQDYRQLWVRPGDVLDGAGGNVTLVVEEIAYNSLDSSGMTWRVRITRTEGKLLVTPKSTWRNLNVLGELVFPVVLVGEAA